MRSACSLVVVVLSLASGCGELRTTSVLPTAHDVRRVLVVGEQDDLLGETAGAAVQGHVVVHTNDGRELWVNEVSLATPLFAPGRWVLFAYEGDTIPAEIVHALDDYLVVRVGDSVGFLSIRHVVAMLHQTPAELGMADEEVLED